MLKCLNDEKPARLSFVIGASSFFRHSSLDIRHSCGPVCGRSKTLIANRVAKNRDAPGRVTPATERWQTESLWHNLFS
jgi:hypothetical protein